MPENATFESRTSSNCWEQPYYPTNGSKLLGDLSTVVENDLLYLVWAHAAMCALGIDELGQQPAEILLPGSHAEQNTLGAHVPVENLHIGNGKTQFDFPRGSCRKPDSVREWSRSSRTAPASRLELDL